MATKASHATRRAKSLRSKERLDACRTQVTLAHLAACKALYEEWDQGVPGNGATISQMSRDWGTGTNRIREMLIKGKHATENTKGA